MNDYQRPKMTCTNSNSKKQHRKRNTEARRSNRRKRTAQTQRQQSTTRNTTARPQTMYGTLSYKYRSLSLTRVSFLSTDFYGHSNGDRRRCRLRARLIFQRKKDIKDLQVHTKDPKDRARGTGWFFNVKLRTL